MDTDTKKVVDFCHVRKWFLCARAIKKRKHLCMSDFPSVSTTHSSGRHAAPRVTVLDGLRGIAALWVVIFHFTFGVGWIWNKIDVSMAARITPTTFNFQGVAAVWLFFIISGYVIFMTLVRCGHIGDFLVSRAARLFPTYWAALIVSASLIAFLPFPGQAVSVVQVMGNATMLEQYASIDMVDTVYWSLTYELTFYALIAILFMAGRMAQIEVYGTCFMVATMLAHHAFPGMMHSVPWRLQTLLMIPYSPLFLAGVIIYKGVHQAWTTSRIAILGICFAMMVWDKSVLDIEILTCIFGVFLLSVLGYAGALSVKPLLFLGRVSYPLYIIHDPLGSRAQWIMAGWGIAPWLNLTLVLVLVISAAWLLDVMVSRPAGRLIHQAWRQKGMSSDKLPA